MATGKHWIGWISPPSVLAYRETDSMNVFDLGGAAFNRAWAEIASRPPGVPVCSDGGTRLRLIVPAMQAFPAARVEEWERSEVQAWRFRSLRLIVEK